MNIEEAKEKEIINNMSRNRQFLRKVKKKPSSETKRIPIEMIHEFEKMGNGNFKKGLMKSIISYHTHDPKELLMKDCDMLMDHLKLFFSDNHYQHFDNFPAFFRRFLETGLLDVNYLIKESKNTNNLDEVVDDG